MKSKNNFYRRSRIDAKKFVSVLKYFALDKTASETARLTKINVRSINPIYLRLRQRIAENIDQQLLVANNLQSPIKVSRRPVQRPCQIEGSKILVLVLSEFDQSVHLEVVPDARKNQSLARQTFDFTSLATENSQAQRLWQYLDQRLLRFRGIGEETFHLHVKETAFRFNHSDNLLPTLIKILEQKPL